MEQIPVRQQFVLMQFGPCLNQAPLFLRQRSGNHFHRAHREDGSFALIIRMEMNVMVRRARFGKHADDDTKKATDFRHRVQSYPPPGRVHRRDD